MVEGDTIPPGAHSWRQSIERATVALEIPSLVFELQPRSPGLSGTPTTRTTGPRKEVVECVLQRSALGRLLLTVEVTIETFEQ